VVYVALLLPWRAATTPYALLLAPPADAIATLLDPAVDVAADHGRLRYVRLFQGARTPARDDLQVAPVLFEWMRALFGPLHRAMYPYQLADGAAARPTAIVQSADLFRFTLELPLFLALVLALPGVPWRRRLRPTLVGGSILAAVHLFLTLAPAFWLMAGEGHLRATPLGVEHVGPGVWLTLLDRYQYVGPVLAFALFLALVFLGAFDPRAPRAPRACAQSASSEGAPSEGDPSEGHTDTNA
jgi:hypothetical protein